jgi:hypothetical protein
MYQLFAAVKGVSLPLVTPLLLTIEQDMDSPVHLYYVLHDYYQNHKRYVRSVSYSQLHGSNESSGSLKDCIPQRYLTGQPNPDRFVNSGLINPCGLIAWSFMNDTFSEFMVRTFYFKPACRAVQNGAH